MCLVNCDICNVDFAVRVALTRHIGIIYIPVHGTVAIYYTVVGLEKCDREQRTDRESNKWQGPALGASS